MSRVVVAGSINMDVVAMADRHPAIGETVAGRDVLYFPGGKGANQAVAAAKLGAETLLVGCIGTDAFGHATRAFLASQGVDLTHLQEIDTVGTGTAIITVAEADNTIVVVSGANAHLGAQHVDAPALQRGDIAVSQFEIPLPAITAFFTRARAAGATTILNPAPARTVDQDLMNLIDVLIVNESELSLLANVPLHETAPDSRFIDAASKLQTSRRPHICVTRGKRGVVALIDGEVHVEAGCPVVAKDTTGAGDCFVGAIAARLADGASLRSALRFANVAASICVQRIGAGPSMPTTQDVLAAVA